jgi:hypothetical protein
MMVVRKVVTTGGSNGLQLVVGKVAELATGDAKCVVELVVRIIHLIDTEHRFQASFVKRFVVGNKWQALDKRLYLCPYLGKHRSFVGVGTAKAMHSATPIIIIVGLWLNKGIEGIHYLPIPHNDDANGTN